MDLLKDMGQRFRLLRINKGYTAKDVSIYTGVSLTAISRLEMGEYLPPHSVHEDLCRVLGTTFSEFMSVYRWTYTEVEERIDDTNEDYGKAA